GIGKKVPFVDLQVIGTEIMGIALFIDLIKFPCEQVGPEKAGVESSALFKGPSFHHDLPELPVPGLTGSFFGVFQGSMLPKLPLKGEFSLLKTDIGGGNFGLYLLAGSKLKISSNSPSFFLKFPFPGFAFPV